MEEARCVSDLGSQYFWNFFRFEGNFFCCVLTLRKSNQKSPSGRRTLNTIVARRSSALFAAPSVAIFGLFLGAFRCHFGAEFKAKKCQGSKEYVKKKWTALPRKAGT